MRADGSFLMAVLPAHERVDLVRLSTALGARVSLADEADMQRLFPECEAGAQPPLGELYHLPVVIDAALARESTIFCNGGTHADLLELGHDDFMRIAGGRIINYGMI
jgi:Ala-tRNA(Pro) deacylase